MSDVPRLRGAIALLAVAVLGCYTWQHPPALLAVESGPWGWPERAKCWGAIRAVGAVIALDLAAWNLGLWLGRGIRPAPASCVGGVMRFGLGLLGLGTLVFVLGLCGFFSGLALAAVTGALVVLGLPNLLASVRSLESRFARPTTTPALVAISLIPALLEAFVPRFGWDALTYHLALPQRWLEAERVFVTPFSFLSAFPHLGEALYALALSLGGNAAAKLLCLQFGLLLLYTLWALASSFSLRAAWLAPVLLLADPLFSWELGAAYTDLPLCFYTLLCVAVLSEWMEHPTRSGLTVVGCFAGACFSVRYLGGGVLAVVVGILLATARRRGFRPTLAAVAGVSALTFVVAAPYLLRNLWFTGNPVAPAAQALFHMGERPYFDVLAVEQMVAMTGKLGMGRGIVDLLHLPWNLTMLAQPKVYSGFGFQVGALPLITVPAALFQASVRTSATGRWGLTAAGALTLLWFFTFQEARYLLPIFPILAWVGALAIDTLSRGATSTFGKMAGIAILAAPIYGLALCVLPGWMELRERYSLAFGSTDLEAFETTDPAAGVGRALREDEESGFHRYFMLFESRDWYFRGVDAIPYHLIEGPITLGMFRHSTPGVTRCRLDALGATDVVVNLDAARNAHPEFVVDYGPADWESDLSSVRTFLAEWTDIWLEREWVVVARLRPVVCPHPG